jgi:hypothetical protein
MLPKLEETLGEMYIKLRRVLQRVKAQQLQNKSENDLLNSQSLCTDLV